MLYFKSSKEEGMTVITTNKEKKYLTNSKKYDIL